MPVNITNDDLHEPVEFFVASLGIEGSSRVTLDPNTTRIAIRNDDSKLISMYVYTKLLYIHTYIQSSSMHVMFFSVHDTIELLANDACIAFISLTIACAEGLQ